MNDSETKAPTYGLAAKTAIFDLRKNTIVAWIDGAATLPVGATVELHNHDTNTFGTATVKAVRLMAPMSSDGEFQISLDCDVHRTSRHW
jgi:hypothetical protein